MANNEDVNNMTIPLVPYQEDIHQYILHIIQSSEGIKALANLEKNVRRHAEDQKNVCVFIKNTNILLETQLKQQIQNKESLLDSLESHKSRNEELKKMILLAKEQQAHEVKERIETLENYEEKWLTCKTLYENIPFIKSYNEKNNEIETIKGGIKSIHIEVEEIHSDIILKETELLNIRNKNIVELADYMINKKPLIIKRIHEATNGIKKLKNEKQILKNKPFMENKLPTSSPTKLTIEAKKISTEDALSVSRHEARNTFVLPQLRLTAMDTAPISNFNQKINCNNTAKANKRPFESFITKKFHTLKKANITEKSDEVNVSTYLFATPKTMNGNNTRKYPDDKLIRVLKDVKLDTTGTYKIVSLLKANHLQDVNVIKARESRQDLKTKDPPQDNVIEDEVIDKIDLTKKVSQDIILPPTQFLDFTLSPQEKRVTFNGVITIADLPNLVTNDAILQDDNVINNPPNSQLNASTASDDSYKKIKDFIFKKHNVNLSPEFTYTKNKVVPTVAENKIVTSKFFDERQEGNNNNDSSKIQNMEIVEIVDEEPQLKQAQECPQKDDAPLAAPAFANRIRDIPGSLNISMNKTGCEDDEGFPHCIDSSLLLSPKADDEMQTNNNTAETQPREVPSFLSGYRRTGFSLFGTNEADAQNQNNNFNFNFGGNEKAKKGGFFSMFK